MNIAIVTGASSGMGRETACFIDRLFDDSLDEIWIIARRKDRLQQLSSKLTHKTYILPLDLKNENDLDRLYMELSIVQPTVKMLVNASGFGLFGKFSDFTYKDQADMIRLNCEALVKMTGIVLPYMSKGGRIVQFASSAAFMPQPGFAVYAASKAFVLSFSKALNQELKDRNISVTAVCPGPVDTEFFKVAERLGKSLAFKKYFMKDPKEVVKDAMIDAYHRRAVSISGIWMKLFYVFAKMVPHDIILFVMKFMK